MSPPLSDQKHILSSVTYIQQLTIIKRLMYNILSSSGFHAHYTCICKSSDAFASIRYLTISVWPFSDDNINALDPSFNEKTNMELFHVTTFV